MVAVLDLDGITLHKGGHNDPAEGHCMLEVVSMIAGEGFGDHPVCVDATLAAFGRSWNDGMRSDEEREQLKRYIPVLPGTAGTDADASRRAWLALDWSVRVSTPAWLDLAGLADQAAKLRGLPELTERDEDVEALLRSVRSDAYAAGAAARAAAWAAAEEAAWAAAWAAARAAAWAAAGAAAEEAARAAAWAAAEEAAWVAARDAAEEAAEGAAGAAAEEAARAAAWDALEPTVTELQTSAHGLYVRMIEAGPHDPAALAHLKAGGA